MANKKIKGEQAFQNFYREIYGDRWENLSQALLKEKGHAQFRPNLDVEKPYYLDSASITVAQLLDVRPGDEVLDLCAAPGGKSLVLAQSLRGEGRLVSNDRSRNRRQRLEKVLNQYLTDDEKSVLKISGHDATQWCLHEKEAYDKILLDAPCSSERHLLEKPIMLKEWGEGRSKRLAIQQWTMLASAFLVLRPGGRMVYSTCSISPWENERVIAKLEKKFKGEFSFFDYQDDESEEKDFGRIVLPDKKGNGPLYFCIIDKLKD